MTTQNTPITVRTLKSDWGIMDMTHLPREPDLAQVSILFSQYALYDAKTQMFFAKEQDMHHPDRDIENGIAFIGAHGMRHFKYSAKNSVYTSFVYVDSKENYHLFIFVDQESLDSYWKSIRARTDAGT
jgi:hypothetical protein